LGLERISESQTLNSTWTPSFYGYDGHGSVRQLTNSAGAVTDTYDYDAFGNIVNQTGSTPNNYLFAGEQYDPALSLYYNRARYLNTSTGRFWSMDSYEGNDQGPLSLHKYLYTGDNPVNKVDRSGHDEGDLGSTVGALSVGETIDLAPIIQGAILSCYVYGALSGGGPCGDRSEPKVDYFHYTPLSVLPLILNSQQLLPSTGGNAVYGVGQYLTDISPAEAGGHRKEDLSTALYNDPNHWEGTDVGYLEIQFESSTVQRVNDVYSPVFPGKGIFLHPALLPYPLSGVVVGSGPVSFTNPQ
jgi:RHS repeat-associated protein